MTKPPAIDTVAILGLGLMGASLGLAAQRRHAARRVVGWARREETRRQALAGGMVDAVAETPAEAVREAQLVVCCLPVLRIADCARSCRDALPAGSVFTDVGSTKSELVVAVTEALRGSRAHFVGSHPVAGSDQTGLAAARETLYDGAVVVVTPPDGRTAPGLDVVEAWWRAIGAQVRVMSPEAHDQMIARTSHLPHLTACALTQTVLAGTGADAEALCGSGFRDSTRIAAGSEEIWHDIIKTNREAVQAALRGFEAELGRMRGMVERGDFEELKQYLAAARALRRDMRGGGVTGR